MKVAATAARIVEDDLPLEPAGTDIVITVTRNPGIVLLDREKFNAWYEKLAAKAPQDADVSTKKGRDALRSFAAEVRSEKAAIDKARLQMTKEWRDMVDQANDAGKEIKEQLESLAVTVRAPLTAWEEAEEARVNQCRETIARFGNAAIVTLDDTADAVRQRGMNIWATKLDADVFQDLLPEAQAAKEATVTTLKAALARLEKEEADAAELEKLRAEAAERAEADRLAAEEAARVEAAKEAARREAEELAAYNERRAAAEAAELERIASEREAAAQAARDEEARKAEEERQRIQREHDEALAAERKRAEDAEAARQQEADRIEAERLAAEKEAQRLADEQAKRDADQKHRTRVKAAAKTAIMSCGADEETARKIVMAIIAGEVPAVMLRF